ncbi:uncharacterized protein LOC112396026 isoform X1 [Neophocaena asiaeorientalis asiaeorientalis]|uniref:Uncharacterized protein LOC112396026 isoform X1 n=1 Tax=Neophocaena asiaeorientalis asiaeorientalis TaxID=1706337 RepID=A0A341AXP3_NEOAA|nr:uncharacterized protein LOC112396026 isoform X1 [Neophocaena asiaeorientalis asiaeorientalis]
MVATPPTLSKQLCVLTGVACVYLTGHRASPLGGREEEEAAVGAGFQGDARPGCELDQVHSGSSGKPRFLPVDLDLNLLKKLPVEPIVAFAAGGGWGLTSGLNVWVWHLSGCPCGRSSLWTEPGLHSLLTLQVDGWTRGQVGAVLGLGSSQVFSAGRGPEAPRGLHLDSWCRRGRVRLWPKPKPRGPRTCTVRLPWPFCTEAWPRLALSQRRGFLL